MLNTILTSLYLSFNCALFRAVDGQDLLPKHVAGAFQGAIIAIVLGATTAVGILSVILATLLLNTPAYDHAPAFSNKPRDVNKANSWLKYFGIPQASMYIYKKTQSWEAYGVVWLGLRFTIFAIPLFILAGIYNETPPTNVLFLLFSGVIYWFAGKFQQQTLTYAEIGQGALLGFTLGMN